MLKFKKRLQILGIFVCLLIILLIIFKNKIEKNFYTKQDTLRLSLSQDIKNFDPAISFSDDSLTLISQSYDTLFQYHYLKRPYELIPSMAQSMPKIEDKGKTYIIEIKPDLYYHEHPSIGKNRTVVAEDFINAIKRLAFKPLHSTGDWLFKDKIIGLDKFAEDVGDDWRKIKDTKMEGLKAIDDLTLKIQLKNPDLNFLYYLSMIFTTPIPWELIEWTKNDLSKVMIGTGPYVYLGFPNEVYKFKKFDKYRIEHYPSVGDRYANTHNLLHSRSDLLPFISKLEFKVNKTEEIAFDKFMQGDLDIVLVPKSSISSIYNNSSFIKKDKNFKEGIELKHFSKITSRWIGFNMKDPILGKNKLLRKAIAFAIDRKKYVQITSSNSNLVANSILNPSIPGYKPSDELPYFYDLKKARELIHESKVDLKKLPPIIFSTRGTDETQKIEAEFFKTSLEKIGLKVEINYLEFSDFLKKGRAGELMMWIDNWIYDYPVSENSFQLLLSKNHPGINKSAYSNKRVDQLFNKLTLEENKFERYEIMYEIEKIVNDDLPWIMLMYESSYMLHRSNLKNFRRSYFIRNYMKYLKLQ